MMKIEKLAALYLRTKEDLSTSKMARSRFPKVQRRLYAKVRKAVARNLFGSVYYWSCLPDGVYRTPTDGYTIVVSIFDGDITDMKIFDDEQDERLKELKDQIASQRRTIDRLTERLPPAGTGPGSAVDYLRAAEILGPESTLWMAYGGFGSVDIVDLMEKYAHAKNTRTYSMQETAGVLNEVYDERKRQHAKWGEQNHNLAEWVAILTEEVGEASREAVDFHFQNPPKGMSKDKFMALAQFASVQQGRREAYRAELVQVAAVACQMIESHDRNFGPSNIIK